MKIRLRTLLLVLAIVPLALAAQWFKDSRLWGRDVRWLGSMTCLVLLVTTVAKLLWPPINRALFGLSKDNRPKPEYRMVSLTFSIRDWLWLMAVLGMALGWWLEYRQFDASDRFEKREYGKVRNGMWRAMEEAKKPRQVGRWPFSL